MTTPDKPAALDRRNMIGAGLGVLGGVAALSALTAPKASAAAIDAVYFSQTPVRVADSRDGTGTSKSKILVGQTRTVDLSDDLDLDVLLSYTAIVNLTVVTTQKAGFLRLWETGQPEPATSNVNWFAADQTFANLAFVGVGVTQQSISVRAGGQVGSGTDFVIDLLGYFRGVSLPPVVGRNQKKN